MHICIEVEHNAYLLVLIYIYDIALKFCYFLQCSIIQMQWHFTTTHSRNQGRGEAKTKDHLKGPMETYYSRSFLEYITYMKSI